jgi:hypothetical protein
VFDYCANPGPFYNPWTMYWGPFNSPASCNCGQTAWGNQWRQTRYVTKWDVHGQRAGKEIRTVEQEREDMSCTVSFGFAVFSSPSSCVSSAALSGNLVWQYPFEGAPQHLSLNNNGLLVSTGLFQYSLNAAPSAGGQDGYVRVQKLNYNCRLVARRAE